MQYTPADVFRTAQRYIDISGDGSFGAGLSHGINQVCICCKSGSNSEPGSVEKIINEVEIKPWSDFYNSGKLAYSAYRCLSCGYMWSWYKPSPT